MNLVNEISFAMIDQFHFTPRVGNFKYQGRCYVDIKTDTQFKLRKAGPTPANLHLKMESVFSEKQ